MTHTPDIWHSQIQEKATALADEIARLQVSPGERAGVMLLTACHFAGHLAGLLQANDGSVQPMEYYVTKAYRLINVGAPRPN